MGGLLTLPSFTKQFPEIDTTAKGTAGLSKSAAQHKSTIQGKLLYVDILEASTDLTQASPSHRTTLAVSSVQLAASGLEISSVAGRPSFLDHLSWSLELHYNALLSLFHTSLSADSLLDTVTV
jgi:hypothetical protein